jgi:hypothetical protein
VPGVFTGITTNDINIIATQHFNIGNEDINIDITSEINDIISGTTQNNGFMLCFDSKLEQTSKNIAQYVGFFTNNTNTFFKPYLETTYGDPIIDDRNEFILNKDNRLYFYSVIGGEFKNLDELPICRVNNTNYVPKQASKGVYYIDINLSQLNHQPNVMMYDIWSNLKYNGKPFREVELEFVTKDQNEYFNLGGSTIQKNRYVPTVYGVNFGEKINRGQKITINISPRVAYTTNTVTHITGMEYRLYVKEMNKEITVIEYDSIHRANDANYFTLFTDDLLPNEYYVDIKINRYDEEIIHKEKLKFTIVNEL